MAPDPLRPPPPVGPPPERIVVGMSGGVDSSVAAALCVEQGYEVVGVFLRNGIAHPPRPAAREPGAERPRAERPRCCSAADGADARAVAARLGIAFYAVDEASAFDGLIEGFVDEYVAGRTPNPCVACNRAVKIAALERVADAVGAAWVATGHYARHDGTGTRLRRALDPAKDQTYFLAGLTDAQVARCRFPLGALPKTAVRAAARRLGLAVAAKPESQEICFVAGRSYRDLVAERRPEACAPGLIVDAAGRTVGRHDGVAGFTIGQRRGLGLGGGGAVRHVLAIDPARRLVVVGAAAALARTWLRVAATRWWGGPPPTTQRVRVQIRHRHAPVRARVHVTPVGAEVQLDAAVHGVAPGQVAAFYDDATGEILLGAGTIVAQSQDVDGSPSLRPLVGVGGQTTDSAR